MKQFIKENYYVIAILLTLVNIGISIYALRTRSITTKKN